MVKAVNKLRGSYKNILNLPLTAESIAQGQNWYKDANKIAYNIGKLASYKKQSDCVRVGAGILSALSPTISWGDNVNIAILLVTSKGQIRKTYRKQHDKAVAIMHGANPMEVLGENARKTKAFYRAIQEPNNDYSEPVVDRHGAPIYKGSEVTDRELQALSNPKVYDRISNAYIRASKEMGINRHILQASTWTQWRINKGIVNIGTNIWFD